jgi:hypothetical protein
MSMEHWSEKSPASNPPVNVRPKRDVRLIEESGRVVAFPEPHRTPVLPAGWAPLSGEQQDAVLRACDAAPESMIIRLGSLWEPAAEYRVYRLANELWGGLSIVSKTSNASEDPDAQTGAATNRQLLGLAWDTVRAVRIAIDFFNWDLEAQGQPWRLDVNNIAVEHS